MATLPNVPDEASSAQFRDSDAGSPAFHSHEMKSIAAQAPFSLEELIAAGFSALELKEAGHSLSSLKVAGINFKQLKDAGFDASAFKSEGYAVAELREAGFTAEELKNAGFDFSCLKAIGIKLEDLKAAGFDARVFKSNGHNAAELKRIGFTAKELSFASSSESKHHQQINNLIESRIRLGRIFGESWREFLGFFAPYGTQNGFWNRLKASPMIRHIFVHDSSFIDGMKTESLLDEAPSPQITASDVDSAVNNCALICALLISIPAGLISNMGQSDFYINMISSGQLIGFQNLNCTVSNGDDFPSECIGPFKQSFTILATYVLASFYTNIFVLMMAVLYYMCRPSESYNISSSLTLVEAYTIEVRKRIRKERHTKDAESTKPPSEPFENPLVEFEVFSKASFYAQNETEEQKNQEFYMWYKSKQIFFNTMDLLRSLPASALCSLHH
jgi:hypothetical protein